MSNMQISHVLKRQYLGKIRCLNTTHESITSEVVLKCTHAARARRLMHTDENVVEKTMKRGLIRAHKRCCLARGIACSYILIFLLRNLRVPIGRHVAWFIQIYVPDRITSLKSADPAQINNINYYLGPGKDDEVSLTFIS